MCTLNLLLVLNVFSLCLSNYFVLLKQVNKISFFHKWMCVIDMKVPLFPLQQTPFGQSRIWWVYCLPLEDYFNCITFFKIFKNNSWQENNKLMLKVRPSFLIACTHLWELRNRGKKNQRLIGVIHKATKKEDSKEKTSILGFFFQISNPATGKNITLRSVPMHSKPSRYTVESILRPLKNILLDLVFQGPIGKRKHCTQ